MKNKVIYIVLSFFGLIISCTKSDLSEELPSPPTIDSVATVVPKLTSVIFRCDTNPYQLSDDVVCEIIDDSLVVCRIPNVVENKQLIPDISYTGDKLLLDDIQYVKGNRFDFQKPVKLTLLSEGVSKDYILYVHSFTGLPVMWIDTEWRQAVTSKEEYLNASFKLEEGQITRGAGDVIIDSVKIKGRGHTSWEFEKKPYRLKFNKKVSLLDEPEDKSWILLANYNDKTMLRNQISLYLGRISKLEWTPRAHFVELMLNGMYNGTYLLCERIKVSENRINIGNDGILIEIDAYAKNDVNSRYFTLPHIENVVNIKEPDVEYDDDTYNFAKELMTKAEAVLFSDNFTDEIEGWRKYLDQESFIDWYLINEITRNADAWGWSSIYFNYKPGGKIKMGPIWDFDLSFGNYNFSSKAQPPEGFYIMQYMPWFSRLFEDPLFVKSIKERFQFFYGHKETLFKEINENTHYLKYAVVENDNRWNTLYTYSWKNSNVWGNYDNEVQCLKQWLNTRMEWLKRTFDSM